mmetsp:Transcript_13452/g.48939  ORF Transcript_13452/g.48939 Transcript_13452/m.48939 type:complete len:269 (+) Transcript_13452:277-1083(+)
MTAAPKTLDPRESVEAAVFHAAEWQRLTHICAREVVQRSHSRLDSFREFSELALISRENVRAQSIRAVIHHLHKLVLGFKGTNGHNRAKHLLLGNLHVRGNTYNNGGGIKLAFLITKMAPDQNFSPFRHSVIDQGLHALCGIGHAHRSTIDHRVQGRPLSQRFRDGQYLLGKFVADGLVDEEALSTSAVLPAGLKGTSHGRWNNLSELSILQHNERVLATQLQHHRRQSLSRLLHDELADRRGPHKHQLIYLVDECLGCLCVPWNDLH